MLKATDRKVDPIKERVTRIKDRSTIESVRNVINMTDSGKDSLIDNDNNTLTNSKVTDRAISITYKDKENDILKEMVEKQNNKEIIKKGMVKEMKEMFERQNCKRCGKSLSLFERLL